MSIAHLVYEQWESSCNFFHTHPTVEARLDGCYSDFQVIDCLCTKEPV